MEFSKSDRYSGAGHEYRRGIVRGLENRLTLHACSPKETSPSRDPYTVPWKEGFRCLRPRNTIQLRPSFETVSFERRLKAALSRAPASFAFEKKGRRIPRSISLEYYPTLCKFGSGGSPALPLLSSSRRRAFAFRCPRCHIGCPDLI